MARRDNQRCGKLQLFDDVTPGTAVYLPITSQPRELNSKLLLALFAKEKGLHPVLGYKSAFNEHIGLMPPGVVLVHNARQAPYRLKEYKDYGHNVLVQDEEALIRQSDEIFLKKHALAAFDNVDGVLTWGQDDLEMWRGFGALKPEYLHATGNPRGDLLRPELRSIYDAEVDQIRSSYGDFILINTNFPTVSNQTAKGGGVRLAKSATDDKGREASEAFLANKFKLFEAFKAMVPKFAAAVAPHQIVLRPHPNEDHKVWSELAKGIPNLKVVFEGAVVPWLLAAKVLVQNNCTTAVEAAMLDVDVVNFAPWRSEFLAYRPLKHRRFARLRNARFCLTDERPVSGVDSGWFR